MILGGGSSHLQGRQDGRDLVAEWRQGWQDREGREGREDREGREGGEDREESEHREDREGRTGAATVVSSRQELAGVKASLTSSLLGVFAPDTLDYHLDREERSSNLYILLKLRERYRKIMIRIRREFPRAWSKEISKGTRCIACTHSTYIIHSMSNWYRGISP